MSVNIKVFKRLVFGEDRHEHWKDGFPTYGLIYPNGKYSNEYGIEDEHQEIIIYEGTLMPMFRVLPLVDPKYLITYCGGQFRSQVIPHRISCNLLLCEIADAVRGTCRGFYDKELYSAEGKIISSLNCIENEEIYNYLFSLFQKEDWERIAEYKKSEDKWFE